MTGPPIMFCDEPTTGLDTFSALNVMKSLKSLAEGVPPAAFSISHKDAENERVGTELLPRLEATNRTKAIMCSIHHPTAELFEMFTHIVIMHAGAMTFQGTLDEAKQFFLRWELVVGSDGGGPWNEGDAFFSLKYFN